MKQLFAQFFSTDPQNVFLFAKGRVALYAVLKAMGVGPGDEVIIPGYTCVMVPSAPIFLGATCRYVDIDPATFNLDPRGLNAAFSPRTKALIIQHTYGIAQEMEPVLKWAKERGVPIIEDCCHAFGSKERGKLCGTFGIASFFSGQWNKPFSTGLGGMLLVNQAVLRERVAAIYGKVPRPPLGAELRFKAQILAHRWLVNPRTNGWITQAYRGLSSLGVVAGSSESDEFGGRMPKGYFRRMAKSQEKEGAKKMGEINKVISHRKHIASFYADRLSRLGFKPLSKALDDSILLRYPLRVGGKTALLKEAVKSCVEVGSWFEIPLHPRGVNMETFGYRIGMCPESELACRETVNLPTHAKISEKEAARLLSFISSYI